MYDPRAITNEDAELNQRILEGGGKVYLSRDVVVHYYPRKDFRTLAASRQVASELAAVEPAPSATGRKRQIKAAIAAASEQLANTPTVCRKSYVHDAIVEAFESGRLKRLKASAKAPSRPDLVAVMLKPAA